MILQYNVPKMEELLQSFYRLSGIRIVVFSDDFRKVAEAPGIDSGFCRLIRSDRTLAMKCQESDREGCRRSGEIGKLHTYTCHAGMTETVTPIRHGNLSIGYLMFGQILQSGQSSHRWAEIRKACEAYHVDLDLLREAYEQLQPVEMERVYAAAKILEACAGQLWQDRAISLQNDSLPGRIDAYITNNLGSDLSVKSLCAVFDVSRSKLYKLFRESYGNGIEQTIRWLRISKAQELLDTSDYPGDEIGSMVGYPDYNYFIKVFRKETGMTPLRYRKQ